MRLCSIIEQIHVAAQSYESYCQSIHARSLCECANTLWKYVRANLYKAEQVKADLIDLKALRFQVTSTKDLIPETVQIGLDYGITAYDACYVALSQRVVAPLLTLDERLVNSLASSNFDVRLFMG